eukprot:1954278-Rhodomonas_salina.2
MDSLHAAHLHAEKEKKAKLERGEGRVHLSKAWMHLVRSSSGSTARELRRRAGTSYPQEAT